MGKKKHVNDETQLLKEQLARAIADYDNLSKRVEREREANYDRAKAHFLTALMPIFDMLEGVQDHVNDPGLAIALKELDDVLSRGGIEKISPRKGDVFDENSHEVVEAIEGKGKNGEILEVILNGYKIKDGAIIRPAKVIVTK